MKPLVALVASLVVMSSSAKAEVRITDDEGGSINQYFARYQALRDAGETVVIDGLCMSACTLVLGILPRDRVCVTDGAMLGFHAAWRPDGMGGGSRSEAQTQRMMETYPPSVRRWLSRRGGLSSEMVFVHGRALNAMVRRCRPSVESRAPIE